MEKGINPDYFANKRVSERLFEVTNNILEKELGVEGLDPSILNLDEAQNPFDTNDSNPLI